MIKRNLECLSCQLALNKTEADFVDETTFAFYASLPAGVDIGVYCTTCFDAKVAPALAEYNDKLERAKNVNIFFRAQSKESRFVRRVEKPVRISDCVDRDEVILRLAFKAVEIGRNSLVDVDVSFVKTQNGRWQSSIWSGLGIPATITDQALNRKFLDTCR